MIDTTKKSISLDCVCCVFGNENPMVHWTLTHIRCKFLWFFFVFFLAISAEILCGYIKIVDELKSDTLHENAGIALKYAEICILNFALRQCATMNTQIEFILFDLLLAAIHSHGMNIQILHGENSNSLEFNLLHNVRLWNHHRISLMKIIPYHCTGIASTYLWFHLSSSSTSSVGFH